MNSFLASLDKDSACLINIVDFMDGCSSAVATDEGSVFEAEVPADAI